MKNKEIIWGSIPIIGLETDDDIKKYSLKSQIAIENGSFWHLNKTDKELEIINNKKSKSHIGLKEPNEVKKKKSKALKGKPKSEEHKKNLSESMIGKKQSNETIEKKKILFTGEGNPMYGKNHTSESRNKISLNHGAKVIKKCPHCGKECSANNYPRYHGDNCKLKKIS
jgi:hypothetical protein